MAYRRRGGHNGMGPIIRPPSVAPYIIPPRSPVTDEETDGDNFETGFQSHSPPTTNPNSNSDIEQRLEANNQENEAEYPDETGNPTATRILHQTGGLWFHSREVVDEVVETSYKTYFMGPWYNWSEVPKDAKGMWWKAFKVKFSWDPSMAKMVRKGWEQKCRRRLSDVVCKMCTTKGYRAKWCHPGYKKRIMALRATDKFKKKSAQCSLNKKNPEKEMPTHCQGSKSTHQVKIDLEKKLKRVPTAAEVYYKGHVNKKDKFVDKKAENVWAEFQNKKAANLEDENPKTEDELLLESLGGWKKGKIYGLGSAADNFYVKPHCNPSVKKVRDELVADLQNQVVQLTSKNLEQGKELEETKAGLVEANTKLDETNATMKAIQAQVAYLSQAWKSSCDSTTDLASFSTSSLAA